MTYRPRTAALAAATLALVLAACGSDQDPAIDVPGAADDTSTATSTTSAPEAAPLGEALTFGPIELSGAAEVPGPGDPDGAGQAHVYLEADGRICYDFIGIDGIESASAAHIHQGVAGVAGDVVLALEAPSSGSIDGCIAGEEELAQQIRANPAGFYLNVHNGDFPDGAVRGQLQS